MDEYKFKPNYRHLEVESSQWFRMTPDQREKAAIKVFRESSISCESPTEQPYSSGRLQPSGFQLSVQPNISGISILFADMIMAEGRKIAYHAK